MVIGFDGSRAFTSERTGTENYSYQLLKALAKIDKKNDYIVYIRPGTFHNTIVERNVIFPKNFKFISIKWPRFWTQGGLALQTYKDKLDVLFVPSHTLPIVRKPNLKTVMTVHDLGSEYLPAAHQLKQRIYLSYMQRRQLKGVTKIIAVSQATKDDLVKRVGCDPINIKVVYEGYDQNLFKPVKGDPLIDSLRQYNLKPGKYFLFVGTVQPRKNLERVIKAFAKYIQSARQSAKHRSALQWPRYGFVSRQSISQSLTKDVRSTSSIALTASDFASSLLIVGSKGWMSDQIYKLPKKLGVEDKQSLRSNDLRVKFLGYVPDGKLPALYSGAIALVFPSLFEGFGLPILEAQACGCPVLTSNISSMPEVAGEGAILVNPHSIEDIIRGMERLQVTGYRLQLIKKGFENVKRFSWEKCARETLSVLESI